MTVLRLGQYGRRSLATAGLLVTVVYSIVSDSVSRQGKAVGGVRPSVRLSVRLFSLCLLN